MYFSFSAANYSSEIPNIIMIKMCMFLSITILTWFRFLIVHLKFTGYWLKTPVHISTSTNCTDKTRLMYKIQLLKSILPSFPFNIYHIVTLVYLLLLFTNSCYKTDLWKYDTVTQYKSKVFMIPNSFLMVVWRTNFHISKIFQWVIAKDWICVWCCS